MFAGLSEDRKLTQKAVIDRTRFNNAAQLPFELRLMDFEQAMQDIYDFSMT